MGRAVDRLGERPLSLRPALRAGIPVRNFIIKLAVDRYSIWGLTTSRHLLICLDQWRGLLPSRSEVSPNGSSELGLARAKNFRSKFLPISMLWSSLGRGQLLVFTPVLMCRGTVICQSRFTGR